MAGALVLLSGGMDSTISFYQTLHRAKIGEIKGLVHAITFDYGQRHAIEVMYAERVWTRACKGQYAGYVGTLRPIRLPIGTVPKVGSLMKEVPVWTYESVPDHNEAAEDPAFLPHRNIVMLSIAAMWARNLKCERIVAGFRGGYSDCDHEFEKKVQDALQKSDPSHRLIVESPTHHSRDSCLVMAAAIPECFDALADTLTCFKGREPPCGECLPCLKRAEGFQKFGARDPLLVRLAVEGKI